jgi:hypothetical protein
MAWNGLFQHLEEMLMVNHHEFKHVREIDIKSWHLYRLPNYVSITRGLLCQVVYQQLPIVRQQMEEKC